MSPLASIRVRAALALLALIGQLTPAVALPVYAAATPARRSASCGCVVATALTGTTCSPAPTAEKRGCCGCCGPKADAPPKPAAEPISDAPRAQSNDDCNCEKPNPATTSEPAVPADLPLPVAVRTEAEPHVPQSAPSAPPSLPAPPAPPPRA